MPHSITLEDITDTSVKMVLTLGSSVASDTQATFTASIPGTTVSVSEAATIPAGSVAGDTVEKVLTGLEPDTRYLCAVYITGQPTVPGGYFTTKIAGYNNPRTATQEQWVDLVDKVKSKTSVSITMTDTDPGEGTALDADHFIGVYE